MGFDAPSHWLILAAVAILLFGGYKKLPEMSRSMGRSLRIFKTEMKGLDDDNAARNADATPPAESPVAPPAAPPAATTPVMNGTPAPVTTTTPATEAVPVAPSSQLGV